MNREWFLNLWLYVGIKLGYVSKPYCATHEGNYEYMTEEEREEWDNDGDPCHVAVSVLLPNLYQGIV